MSASASTIRCSAIHPHAERARFSSSFTASAASENLACRQKFLDVEALDRRPQQNIGRTHLDFLRGDCALHDLRRAKYHAERGVGIRLSRIHRTPKVTSTATTMSA